MRCPHEAELYHFSPAPLAALLDVPPAKAYESLRRLSPGASAPCSGGQIPPARFTFTTLQNKRAILEENPYRQAQEPGFLSLSPG